VPDRFFAVSADDAQVDEGMGIDELELGNAAVDGDLLIVVVMGGNAVVGLSGQRQDQDNGTQAGQRRSVQRASPVAQASL
jgi:hypothetical protein